MLLFLLIFFALLQPQTACNCKNNTTFEQLRSYTCSPVVLDNAIRIIYQDSVVIVSGGYFDDL